MAKFTYTVVYEIDPESGVYCASVPALDLATHGKTLEEAREMAREALGLHLEGMLEEQMPIPPDVLEIDRIIVEVASPAAKETTA
jgi:predicted RNase H-like HicB family nuclease